MAPRTALLALLLLLPAAAGAIQTEKYSVAHTRSKDTDMVFVVSNSRFFSGDGTTQARWYTALQSCVRGVRLAGEVVVVANVNGRFMFYGPKNWNGYLKTLDMQWVKARVNKELTCNY
jgi:hypothetical protein